MRIVAVVVWLLAGACGGHEHAQPDAAVAIDAAIDAAVDAPTAQPGADIATALQCGPTPPAGPGNVAELQRATIDTTQFPDALCNDGTAAIVYFRPYTGAANRNRWMINLHGGGSCSSAESCAARWCNCAKATDCPAIPTTSLTFFDRTNMTASGPAMKSADGLFHRGGTGAQTNPLGDYNQVELVYCSSDLWRSAVKGMSMTTINPVTAAPVTYRIDFLGAKILDADISTLRQDTVAGLVYTLGGASTPMPDLDDATEVMFTGDSAGGGGLMRALDYLTDTLKAHSTNAAALQTYGLMDASVGPEKEHLDFGAYTIPQIRSFDQYLTARSLSPLEVGSRQDTSCLAFHAADPRICLEETHVLRNHLTTPFFVRMALRDSNISGNYIDDGLRNANMSPMTVLSFALTTHDELETFANLPSTAEEGAQIAKAPGVFAPACTKHDTIHDNTETFGTTITPPAGSPQRLVQVLENWRTGAGTPTNLLTESMTLADTVCP